MTPSMEWQVSSLELSKRLKELGARQESYFGWWVTLMGDKFPAQSDLVPYHGEEVLCSAFTVAELGEMLPPSTTSGKMQVEGYWCAMETDDEGNTHWDKLSEESERKGGYPLVYHTAHALTEADARAKMLIYILENNLTKGA